MRNRDDFIKKDKELLAKRVSYRCSNPKCRRVTIGANSNHKKSTNIGVAAHICAASSGGPRYDDTMSSEERKSINNGIWLCQECSVLIDKDPELYPVNLLMKWKKESEDKSIKAINNLNDNIYEDVFIDIEENDDSDLETWDENTEVVSTVLNDITALLAACRGTNSWDNRSELKLYSWLENHTEEQVYEIKENVEIESIRKSLRNYYIIHLEMDEQQKNIVLEDYANRGLIKNWIEMHPGVSIQKIADAFRVSDSAVEEVILDLEKEGEIEKLEIDQKYRQQRWIKKY